MTQETKPIDPRPGPLAGEEANQEIMNDSLGTVDLADTADTDPKDDPAAKEGKDRAKATHPKPA